MKAGSASLALVVVCLVATTCSVAAGAEPSPELKGTTLSQAIEELRDAGLNVFYSSGLVTGDMKVEREPNADNLVDRLEQILSPHGLTVKPGPEGAVIIVRDPTSRRGGSLRVTVVSEDDGRPLSGAQVELVRQEVAANTDSEGVVEFLDVAVGSHQVQIESAGHRPRHLGRVAVRHGRATELRVGLPLDRAFLSEIVVTPSAFDVKSQTPEPRQFLDREEVDRVPHLGDDLFRVMPRLPGIVNADTSARFGVRGGLEDETLFLLDGLQLYSPFHFRSVLPVFSTIDSEAVDNVELMTGGFPVEFGDRMSGVMAIHSAHSQEGAKTSAGASFITLRAHSEGQLKDGAGSWLVSARRGYLDWVMRATEASPEGDFLSGPTYYDLFSKISKELRAGQWLSGSIFASYDDMEYDGEEDSDWFDSSDGSIYLWLTLDSDWSPVLYSRTMISVGEVESSNIGEVFDSGSFETAFDSERKLRVFGLKQDWTGEWSESLLFKWGFDARRVSADYDFWMDGVFRDPIVTGGEGPFSVGRDTVLTADGTQLAGYSAARFGVAHGLLAELGLRWDRQDWTPDRDQLSPRVNLIWDLGNSGTLRFAWGRYAQAQGIHELQVEDGVTEFFPAQEAEHTVISYERLFGDGLKVRIDAYRKRLDQVRPYFENVFDPMEIFPPGATDRVQVAPTAFRGDGVECLLQKAGPGRLSWWVSYAYSRAEDRIDGSWTPRTRDQRHAAVVSVNWRPGAAWNFNLTGTFHTGWAQTPVEGVIVQDVGGLIGVQPVLGRRNSDRLPSYSRVDFRAGRVFDLERSRLRFFFEISNLLSRENPRSYWHSYHVTEDGQVVFEPRVDGSWLPLIPSFGLMWEF